jgi:hypothetical protein
MTAGAKVSVFALLAVAILGWGLVATAPTPERPPASSAAPIAEAVEPEPEPEPHEAEPEAEPAPAPDQAEPAPAAPAAPTAAPGPGADEDPERGGNAEESDPMADAYAERERQIERNVQRYDAASQRFADEPREPAWASEREQIFRKMIEEASLGDLLESLECKSSLCRLRMRFNGLTTAGAAVRLGPLARAMGDDRVVRNEGPPDQRIMVIYMARDGKWPDAPGE